MLDVLARITVGMPVYEAVLLTKKNSLNEMTICVSVFALGCHHKSYLLMLSGWFLNVLSCMYLCNIGLIITFIVSSRL